MPYSISVPMTRRTLMDRAYALGHVLTARPRHRPSGVIPTFPGRPQTWPMSDPGPAPLSISWLGHATAVLDFDGVRVLTDPLLRDNVGLLRRVGPLPDPDLWRDPDVVLISHLHHDHAEVSSLRLVPGVPVLTGAANAPWVRRRLGVECPDPGDG